VSIENFLKQRAVNITVAGSYTLSNWYDPQGKLRTFACRTTRVSPLRMLIEVPVVGKVGDHLTSHFRDLGKFEGSISDTKAGGFLLELQMPPVKREKLAEKLLWIEKKNRDPRTPDARKDARFIPQTSHSTLILADGSTHECFIIDLSLSGVAVSSQVQPPIGTPLAVGSCIGRVARLLPDGFAVKFFEQQPNLHYLERRIARAVPSLSCVRLRSLISKSEDCRIPPGIVSVTNA